MTLGAKQHAHRAAMLEKRVRAYMAENSVTSVRDLVVDGDRFGVHVFIRWDDFREDKIEYGQFSRAWDMAQDVKYRIDMRERYADAVRRNDHRRAARCLTAAQSGDPDL